MSLVIRGAIWIGVFLGVALAPLVFAVIGVSEPGRGFATEFSVALGFVGLALMGLDFALVARFRAVAAPFGTDALVQFHRQIGLVGLAFVLVHVALSAEWDKVFRFSSEATPARVIFGAIATAALLALIASSLWRARLRLSYEWWHLLHAVLAVVSVVAALVHVVLVDYYVNSLWKQILWVAMSAAFVALLVWVRIGKPMTLRRRSWTIERLTPERGSTTTLTLRPDGHRGFRFRPGQYAWIVVDRSPFSLTQHPFSFSSSGESLGDVDISIKALGDFTNTVADLNTGTKVYVDGPHGVFSPDQYEGPGFGLIAGGVGITPMLSILRAFAERGDSRPVVVFVANRDWEEATFREELEELSRGLDLHVVFTVSTASPGWGGETGRIDAAMLARHLRPGFERWQYFVCGPNPMMDAIEDALVALNVQSERIHTERFDWV
ncbi:MAG: ferredoxin reductase family protein [Acidimicrobiia bacterium]